MLVYWSPDIYIFRWAPPLYEPLSMCPCVRPSVCNKNVHFSVPPPYFVCSLSTPFAFLCPPKWLGHWDTRTLGYQDAGTPGHWGTRTLRLWDTGTLGLWDTGIMGTGTPGHRNNMWGASLSAHRPQPCCDFCYVICVFEAELWVIGNLKNQVPRK